MSGSSSRKLLSPSYEPAAGALDWLRSLTGFVFVVCVAGLGRCGKSDLASRLARAFGLSGPPAFFSNGGFSGVTDGADAVAVPLQGGGYLLLIDCEGSGNRNSSGFYRLFFLVCWLSQLLLLVDNQLGDAVAQALSRLISCADVTPTLELRLPACQVVVQPTPMTGEPTQADFTAALADVEGQREHNIEREAVRRYFPDAGVSSLPAERDRDAPHTDYAARLGSLVDLVRAALRNNRAAAFESGAALATRLEQCVTTLAAVAPEGAAPVPTYVTLTALRCGDLMRQSLRVHYQNATLPRDGVPDDAAVEAAHNAAAAAAVEAFETGCRTRTWDATIVTQTLARMRTLLRESGAALLRENRSQREIVGPGVEERQGPVESGQTRTFRDGVFECRVTTITQTRTRFTRRNGHHTFTPWAIVNGERVFYMHDTLGTNIGQKLRVARGAAPVMLPEAHLLNAFQRRFIFRLQLDGNLVLYEREGGRVLWASDTCGRGRGPYKLSLSSQGHLTWTDADGAAVWSVGPFGDGDYELVLQQDRNFVLYRDGHAVWATHTRAEPTVFERMGL